MRPRAVRRTVGLLATAALAAVALVVQPVGASTSVSKLVDRTVTCTTGIQGGARVIYLRAQAAFGEGQKLEWLAQATVSAAGQPVPSRPNYRPTLAGMTAGWPAPPPLTSGGVGFHGARCVATRSRVALSSRGLVGGPASQLGDEYTCVGPRSMLVRIRAAFRSPVELKLRRGYYSADGRVTRGQIAVATLAGKPLVYAEVAESGTARLFTSKGCA
jgi:hypothetical protein